MLFTVIIATSGRPDRLLQSLNAVKKAGHVSGKLDEIIVVDNHPEYSAKKVVEEFISESSISVKYLKTEPFNKSKALNAGIKEADTDWLVFTDDDCIPDEKWLKNAEDYIGFTDINVFGGRLVAGRADFPLPIWLRPARVGRSVRSPTFMEYAPLDKSGIIGDNNKVPYGANVFVKADVFDKYGDYDEALWRRCGTVALGCEDAEFAIRVQSAGERIGYCTESVVMHPIAKERANLGYHLRYFYNMGIRDPILFSGEEHAIYPLSLLKSIIMSLFRACYYFLCMDISASVWELQCVSMTIGRIAGFVKLNNENIGVSP